MCIRDRCDFLNVSYSNEILDYWNFEHHILGGNSGTKYALGGNQQLNKKRSDLNYYKERKRGITLDERWKQELSKKQIKLLKKLFNNSEKE